MALIEIWKDSLQDGLCRGCGARMTWGRTVKHDKRMPLTGRPQPLSEHVTHDGRAIQIFDSRDSHFATCPEADKFRKKRTR